MKTVFLYRRVLVAPLPTRCHLVSNTVLSSSITCFFLFFLIHGFFFFFTFCLVYPSLRYILPFLLPSSVLQNLRYFYFCVTFERDLLGRTSFFLFQERIPFVLYREHIRRSNFIDRSTRLDVFLLTCFEFFYPFFYVLRLQGQAIGSADFEAGMKPMNSIDRSIVRELENTVKETRDTETENCQTVSSYLP